jgi:glycosyltransferase involved in cell wall biosynthesis
MSKTEEHNITTKVPEISVMMCAYNAQRYIRKAIDSVLCQTFDDFEFIIIDDGSTDSTAEIIRRYDDPRIQLVMCKHDYISSLNMGLRKCRGKYIARTDADDIILPTRLQEQMELMNQYPEISVCFSWGTTFGSIEESMGHCAKGKINNAYFWLVTGNFLMHPTALIRHDFLLENKIHYKRYPYAEDYKLWADISFCGGQFYVIPKPLIRYRISPYQVSRLHHDEQRCSRLRIQQEIVEELLKRLEHPQKSLIKRFYGTLLRLNSVQILQGDEVITTMYKALRRTKFFVK